MQREGKERKKERKKENIKPAKEKRKKEIICNQQ